MGYSIPSGGSKTTYYADVQSGEGGATRATIVGRGLYSRLKAGLTVDFDVLPHSGIVRLVRVGPAPNSVLSTDNPLGDAEWWAGAAPWFGGGAALLLAGAIWLAIRLLFAHGGAGEPLPGGSARG